MSSMNYELGQDVMAVMDNDGHHHHAKSLLLNMYDSMLSTTTSEFEGESARMIVLGPSNCGKTSLLFHVAYSEAMTSTTGVLMIRHASFSNSTTFPYPSENHDWKKKNSTMIFQNINIVYVSSLHKLLTLLSTTPTRTTLILDDIHLFLPPPNINANHHQEFRLLLALAIDIIQQHQGTLIFSTTNTVMEANYYPYINTIAKITPESSIPTCWNLQMDSLHPPTSTLRKQYQLISKKTSENQHDNTQSTVLRWE